MPTTSYLSITRDLKTPAEPVCVDAGIGPRKAVLAIIVRALGRQAARELANAFGAPPSSERLDP